jgi:PadR family transcriptional regulator, regulatory protein PadR
MPPGLSLLDNLGELRLFSKTVEEKTLAKNTEVDLLSGTLDMLVLKAVSLGPLHGYGVLLRIQQLSRNRLEIQQGSLYPALYRLEHEGWIAAAWGTSENNRRARFYRLTAAGRRRLEAEITKWSQFAAVVGVILGAAGESA